MLSNTDNPFKIPPVEGETPELLLMFHYYISLGQARTPQLVADHFLCSRKHVYALMSKYKWKDRLAKHASFKLQQEYLERKEYLETIRRQKEERYMNLLTHLIEFTLPRAQQAHQSIRIDSMKNIDFMQETSLSLSIFRRTFDLAEKLESSLSAFGAHTSTDLIEQTEMEQLAADTQEDCQNLEEELTSIEEELTQWVSKMNLDPSTQEGKELIYKKYFPNMTPNDTRFTGTPTEEPTDYDSYEEIPDEEPHYTKEKPPIDPKLAYLHQDNYRPSPLFTTYPGEYPQIEESA